MSPHGKGLLASERRIPLHRAEAQSIVGLASVLALVIGGIGLASGNERMRSVGLGLYGLLGSASLVLWIRPRSTASEVLVLGAGLSCALFSLGGTIMVETKLWAPSGFAIGFTVMTLPAQFVLVARGSRVFRHPRPQLRSLGNGRWVPTVGADIALLAATVTGATLCIIGIALVVNSVPSSRGTLGLLPLSWYVGVGLLVLALAFAVGRRRAIIVIVLLVTVVLKGLTSFIYTLPRFPWTAKQAGLTSYIGAHGSLGGLENEFYRDWPGFYSGSAIICHALGVQPMALARWWTLIIGLLSMLGIQAIASRFTASPTRAWLAAILFVLANTIQQDYFSPQSFGFFLGLVIILLVLLVKPAQKAERLSLVILLALISASLAVSHPITPILISLSALILVVVAQVRPGAMLLILVTPPAVWDLIHLNAFSKYVSTNRLGDVSNFAPATAGQQGQHAIIVILAAVLGAGAIAYVGFVAFLALVAVRSRGVVALIVCAVSSATLGLATNYGSEALFRIELFALPWLSIAAALARYPHFLRAGSSRRIAIAAILCPLLVTYLIAEFGDDAAYATRPQSLHEEELFEKNAPAGSILIVAGAGLAPVKVTARYPLLRFFAESDLVVLDEIGRAESAAAVAGQFDQIVENAFPRARNVYFLFTPEAANYDALWGLESMLTQDTFMAVLLRASEWTVISSDRGAALLRLRPTAPRGNTGIDVG